MSFDARLQSPEAPIAFEPDASSDTLLIAFGGLAGALGIPPFEFFNLTRRFPISRLFLRDVIGSWYHRGLPGIGGNVPAVARFLTESVSHARAKRVVLVGNSMGGYAALLFGALLKADVVHAFVPQTFLDKANRARLGDRRWEKEMPAFYDIGDPRFYDLAGVLGRHGAGGEVHVHYDPANRGDRLHAEHLAGLPGVTLHAHAGGGHELVKQLRATGELERIVAEALAPDALAAARNGSNGHQ